MDSAAVVENLDEDIRRKYRELPELKLTLWQAGRLWNVPYDVCEAALTRLVRSGVLCEGRDGQFLRKAGRPLTCRRGRSPRNVDPNRAPR